MVVQRSSNVSQYYLPSKSQIGKQWILLRKSPNHGFPFLPFSIRECTENPNSRRTVHFDCCGKFVLSASTKDSSSVTSKFSIQNRSFCRNFCSGKSSDYSSKWTEDIAYLNESGKVVFSGKGVRSVEPGLDDLVMIGGLKNPFLNASAVAKILEIVKRWKWGPEMETQLDELLFFSSMGHINQALKEIGDTEGSLSLFRWARRQSWYCPRDESYHLLFDRLNQIRDFEGIPSLFDEMIKECGSKGINHSWHRIR